MQPDLERRQALIELLSMPDSPDLQRGHRLMLEGRSDRYDLVPYFTAAFVQARLLELREREADRAATT